MSLTEDIKDYALDLGYSAVGIAPALPFDQFAEKLAERSEDYAALSFLSDFAEPRNTFSVARSLIVVAHDYFVSGFPQALAGKVARVYQSRCYMAPEDRIHGRRVAMMRNFLEGKGLQVGPWPNRRSGVPDRQAAARAGVSSFGRNNFACVPGIGSFVVLATFLVDQELEYDSPNQGFHCPEGCRLCRKACPTGAIVDDARLNPRRCIAYNTFTTRGDETGVSRYIPKELRAKMGGWVHGCDVCQEVCPKNQFKMNTALPVDPYLMRKAEAFSLEGLLELPDALYSGVVEPLMFNYIRDRALFRRNAAIALGNTAGDEAVPALARALRHDEAEVVRAHVAWALGRIGGAAARRALRAQFGREASAVVRGEIAEALES